MEVSREVIQELGTKDFKQIFDQSVKVARAAAESAKQFRKSMKLEVHDMQSKLIAKELKVKEVNSELDNVKQELTIERAQLQGIRTAVEDERGNVAKKNERIAILTAQLQGARTSAKDEYATVVKQDRKITTLTAELEDTRIVVGDERATVAKQDRKIATLPPNLFRGLCPTFDREPGQ